MKQICTLEHAISHFHSGIWLVEARSSSQEQTLSCQWRVPTPRELKSIMLHSISNGLKQDGIYLRQVPCSLVDRLAERLPEIATGIAILLALALSLFPFHHC